MAISVETTLLLQTVLGVAVAVLGIAVAFALVAVPGATPARRALGVVVGLQTAIQLNVLMYVDPAEPWRRSTPENPWLLWYNDVFLFQHLASIALFALIPGRVRWASPRGVLLVVFGALSLVGGAAWLFDRTAIMPNWPRGTELGFLGHLTFYEGMNLGIALLSCAALYETRGAPASTRAPLAFLLVAAFPFLYEGVGSATMEMIYEMRQGYPPYVARLYLTNDPTICCWGSYWIWVAGYVATAALALYAWRAAGTRVGLGMIAFGVARFYLGLWDDLAWGFFESILILTSILVVVAVQRRGALGAFRLPPTGALALALLAMASVFLVVNSYTLGFGNEVILAGGIFAGTLLGLAAALAMLPRGFLTFPWSHQLHADSVDRHLAAYRSAMQAELAAGAHGAALLEKLRPLRAQLGLSDRDHAILEHGMRAAGGGPASASSLGEGDLLLARYRIERTLGEGGDGVVHLARDEKLGRLVALKRLTPDERRDRAALERFQKETRLASALQHPNIVAVHDIEVVGNEAYLVMQYVAGGSLDDRLRRGALPEGEVRAIARDVLSALGALHDQGILHRDVKPSNILLDPSGRAMLSDFSVARTMVSGETVGFTRHPAAPVGTPAYMAPEQARGVAATPRSDIYSLALSLVAALTGRPPVDVSGLSEFEARVRAAGTPAPLPVQGVSGALNEVLAKALAKDPTERYASAAEMLRALDGANAADVTS